jgi:hypothetical protein
MNESRTEIPLILDLCTKWSWMVNFRSQTFPPPPTPREGAREILCPRRWVIESNWTLEFGAVHFPIVLRQDQSSTVCINLTQIFYRLAKCFISIKKFTKSGLRKHNVLVTHIHDPRILDFVSENWLKISYNNRIYLYDVKKHLSRLYK